MPQIHTLQKPNNLRRKCQAHAQTRPITLGPPEFSWSWWGSVVQGLHKIGHSVRVKGITLVVWTHLIVDIRSHSLQRCTHQLRMLGSFALMHHPVVMVTLLLDQQFWQIFISVCICITKVHAYSMEFVDLHKGISLLCQWLNQPFGVKN